MSLGLSERNSGLKQSQVEQLHDASLVFSSIWRHLAVPFVACLTAQTATTQKSVVKSCFSWHLRVRLSCHAIVRLCYLSNACWHDCCAIGHIRSKSMRTYAHFKDYSIISEALYVRQISFPFAPSKDRDKWHEPK